MAYDQVCDVPVLDGILACDVLVCIALDDDTPVCSVVPDDDILVFYLVHNGELVACIRHGIRAAYVFHNDAFEACDHHGIRAVYAIHSDALEAYNIRAVYVVHNDEVVACARHDNVRRRIDIRPEWVLRPLLSAMLKW